MVKYIFRAFVFVCLILIIVTVILVVSAIKKTENYLSSTGSIIGFHESSNAASVDSYNEKNIAPIISFNANGQTYEVLGNFCSTSMKIGDKIDILYEQLPYDIHLKNYLTLFYLNDVFLTNNLRYHQFHALNIKYYIVHY